MTVKQLKDLIASATDEMEVVTIGHAQTYHRLGIIGTRIADVYTARSGDNRPVLREAGSGPEKSCAAGDPPVRTGSQFVVVLV